MPKRTEFQGYLEYRGKIWGEKIHKVHKSIYQLKGNFISFSLFLFHKNISNTFEVIALLLKAEIQLLAIFQSIFASFSPDIQPNINLLT